MTTEVPVAVVGAGVVGLAVAARLLAAGYKVTVIAAKWSPATTSDGAGALWERRKDEHEVLARATLQYYAALIDSGEAAAAGVAYVDGSDFSCDDQPQYAGFACDVPAFRLATPDELAAATARTGEPYRYGVVWRSVIADSTRYLQWLLERVRRGGGTLVQRNITSLAELAPSFRFVVNATGLGARELAGDANVYAVRGQVIRVHAPHITRWTVASTAPSADGNDTSICTYVLPRPTSGVVTCGGTFQRGAEDTATDAADGADIWRRCCALEPGLLDARTVRLDEWVGLRPARGGDVRIELDEATVPGLAVIHAYGHGGCGHSLHWGTALEVLALVDEAARRRRAASAGRAEDWPLLPFAGATPPLIDAADAATLSFAAAVSVSSSGALPRVVTDGELAFLSAWTRERDMDVLRAHLACTHAAATTPAGGGAHEYRCVRQMTYLEPRLPRLGSAYAAALAAGAAARTAPAAGGGGSGRGCWIDVGAGLGADVRKLVVDGWPAADIIAVDVTPALWRIGLDVFRDALTPPCRFVVADLTRHGDEGAAAAAAVCAPGTAAMLSLMAVLHVLNAAQVAALLAAARGLLAPGGTLLGLCAGASVGAAGVWTPPANVSVPTARWIHDATTLGAELERAGFAEVRVTQHSRGSGHLLAPGPEMALQPPSTVWPTVWLRFEARRQSSR